uniref:Uncharacterized protein n=1 Tax=Oryza brachyantha TaxID=4533 RepID=J3MGE8_ORYBR
MKKLSRIIGILIYSLKFLPLFSEVGTGNFSSGKLHHKDGGLNKSMDNTQHSTIISVLASMDLDSEYQNLHYYFLKG